MGAASTLLGKLIHTEATKAVAPSQRPKWGREGRTFHGVRVNARIVKAISSGNLCV
jgi:hypothetical protein